MHQYVVAIWTGLSPSFVATCGKFYFFQVSHCTSHKYACPAWVLESRRCCVQKLANKKQKVMQERDLGWTLPVKCYVGRIPRSITVIDRTTFLASLHQLFSVRMALPDFKRFDYTTSMFIFRNGTPGSGKLICNVMHLHKELRGGHAVMPSFSMLSMETHRLVILD